jgi:hypothetical protein
LKFTANLRTRRVAKRRQRAAFHKNRIPLALLPKLFRRAGHHMPQKLSGAQWSSHGVFRPPPQPDVPPRRRPSNVNYKINNIQKVRFPQGVQERRNSL